MEDAMQPMPSFKEWLNLDEARRDPCYYKVKRRYKKWPSAYASGALVKCRKVGADNWGESQNEAAQTDSPSLSESTFKLEKERGLKGWFDRNRGKGWIDCRASKKGHLVPCGRKKAGKGADRKYPACRPTLSACTTVGVKRKKSGKQVSWKPAKKPRNKS